MTDRAPRRLAEEGGALGQLVRSVEEPKPSAFAQARVWARLREPEPRRVSKWVMASGLALGAIVTFLLMPAQTIDAPRRGLEIRSGGGALETAQIERGRVRTKAGAATVRAMELADLELAPETELVADAAGRTLEIHLESGQFATTPLFEGVRLRIFTEPYTIEGEGAVRIRRDGPDLEIDVVTGTMVVSGPNGSRRLSSGERFSSLSKVPRAEIQPVQDEPSVERAPARPPQRRSRPKLDRPRPVVEERPEAPKPVEIVDRAPVVRSVDTALVDLTPSIPESRVEVVETPESLYRRAIEERSAAKAIELFDRVAKTDSPWAEVSAHQAARLEMRRGHFEDAIARFGPLVGGTFGHEAALDIIECRLAIGELKAAERDIGAFLSRYPESDRSPELRRLQAELERGKNNP